MYDNERLAHTHFPNRDPHEFPSYTQSVVHAQNTHRAIYIKVHNSIPVEQRSAFAMGMNENIDEMPIKWHIVRREEGRLFHLLW